MSKLSRDKGSRTERNLVKELISLGYDARRVDKKIGQLGSQDSYDLEILNKNQDIDCRIEVKCRSNGFKQLYKWIDEYPNIDALIIKADNKPFLVVQKLSRGVL